MKKDAKNIDWGKSKSTKHVSDQNESIEINFEPYAIPDEGLTWGNGKVAYDPNVIEMVISNDSSFWTMPSIKHSSIKVKDNENNMITGTVDNYTVTKIDDERTLIKLFGDWSVQPNYNEEDINDE